jgi:hypothetical protein
MMDCNCKVGGKWNMDKLENGEISKMFCLSIKKSINCSSTVLNQSVFGKSSATSIHKNFGTPNVGGPHLSGWPKI